MQAWQLVECIGLYTAAFGYYLAITLINEVINVLTDSTLIDMT